MPAAQSREGRLGELGLRPSSSFDYLGQRKRRGEPVAWADLHTGGRAGARPPCCLAGPEATASDPLLGHCDTATQKVLPCRILPYGSAPHSLAHTRTRAPGTPIQKLSSLAAHVHANAGLFGHQRLESRDSSGFGAQTTRSS